MRSWLMGNTAAGVGGSMAKKGTTVGSNNPAQKHTSYIYFLVPNLQGNG